MRAAQPADLPAIRGLLAASGRPGQDLTPAHLGSFWIQRDAAGLLGVAGLEAHGRAALVRSLAVRADGQGRGVGRALLAHAESQAGALGVQALYLLTTTAERVFAARGYTATPPRGSGLSRLLEFILSNQEVWRGPAKVRARALRPRT
ncbi:MAG TPA: GNAT family N-acetyltransferase [Burkholderiales bacterium]|nr:GNAT family N-acetyltransferase [Burkholderiales bacterium]